MAQPISIDNQIELQPLTLKTSKKDIPASSLMLHELGKQASTLAKKAESSGKNSAQETQEEEIEYLFANYSTLSPDELQKLLSDLSDQISADSAGQLNDILELIGKLPKDEQDKAMAFLKGALPAKDQDKFPTNGTPKEQFAFLEKYMGSLSLTERRQFILSMVKNEVSANAPSDNVNANDITDDLNYLLAHLSSLTNAEFQALIAKILVEIGIFLSEVQKGSAQISDDQVNIAQLMAKNAQAEATKVKDDIAKQEAEAEAAKHSFWGVLGSIFGNKWVQIILTVVIGLLFCETPLGFVMLAGMVALQASGALDKMTTGLANAMGGGPVAQFFAGVIITAVLTGGAGLIEGGGSQIIAKAASSFAEQETAEVGTKVVTSEAAKLAEEEGTEAATKVVETAAEDSEKTAAKSGSDSSEGANKDENWLTKPGRYYSNTTAMILANNLVSTNVFYNLLISCGVDKKTAAWLSAVLDVIASIVAMAGAIKGTTSTLLDVMSNGSNLIRGSVLATQGVAQAGSATLNIHEAQTTIDIANEQKEMAKPQAEIQQFEQLSRIFSEMIQVTNSTTANLIKNQSGIFTIDFANAWRTVAQGMEISG